MTSNTDNGGVEHPRARLCDTIVSDIPYWRLSMVGAVDSLNLNGIRSESRNPRLAFRVMLNFNLQFNISFADHLV